MYERIIQAVIDTPWAILPSKAAIIQDLLAYRAAGHKLTAEEVQERLRTHVDALVFDTPLSPEQAAALKAEWSELHSARAAGANAAANGIAVIPILGTIIPRGDMLMESSGAVSTTRIAAAFRQAMSNPDVGSIVLDVDSPGGQVGGVDELATEIYQARGQKRIVAVANHLAASAAYWIASSADELVVSPSGEVGSIGVLAMHQDISVALEQEGVKINLLSAGKFKTEGNPFEPLGEEARAAIQARIDEYYQMFTGAVARNRGVKRAEVVSGFGEGRMVGAKQAVSLGMADRVATLDETIDRLRGKTSRRSMSADSRERRLRASLR